MTGENAADGALDFARFAFPPNQLGYCGPAVTQEILERIDAAAGGPELRAIARGFEGAWPYLQLIAGCNALGDPLDPRVVEAYWIGNELLDRVPPAALADSLLRRFGPTLPGLAARDRLLDPLRFDAVPHHAFHVFGVYPWVGLLRTGVVDEPLHVLDRCRIRWGQVVQLDGEHALVVSRRLRWDGRRLVLSAPRPETVTFAADGHALVSPPVPGDWCAMHWDWICDRLDRRRLAALHGYTQRQLDAVNAVPFPAPASVLS